MSIEINILIAAITFLFGALSAVAKIAWSERGERCQVYRQERDHYKNEALNILNHLLEAQKKTEDAQRQLAHVVEKTLQELNRGVG